MFDYALIIHPTSEELLHRYEPGMKHRSRPLVKKILEWMSPFLAGEITGLKSNLGRTASGALVMCPLLMEQMTTLSPRKVAKSVFNTIKFALGLQPKLIGLTAYTAFSGNKGQDLVQQIPIPLTTGSSYTFATIPESILMAADLMEIDLASSQMLIIGATSSVGKFCIEIFSQFVRGIFITAQNQDKLNLMLAELPKEKRAKLRKVNELEPILDQVKIIVVATNRLPLSLNLQKIKAGAVIFDASYPRRIPNNLRDDLLVIDGVAVKPPGKVNFNFDFGLPEGICFPCMAEPMILALEQKYENYSLGKESEADKVRQIMRFAAKHGFEIATLTSYERAINNETILRIKSNAEKKKKKVLLWR